MKILCISPLFPSMERPYYCIYLLQQLMHIQKMGNDVYVLIPDKNVNNGQIKKEVYEGIPVYRVGYSELNFGGIIGHISKKFKSATDAVIKEVCPDVIALNLCSLIQTEHFLKRRYLKIPIFIHFHGLNIWHEYKTTHPVIEKLREWKKRRVYKKADGVIGVSQKVCDIAKQHIKADKVFKVYNGVDTSVFYRLDKKNNSNSPFTIACIGNLIEIKGHEYLLKAVAEVKKNLKIDIAVDIIGKGPKEETLKVLCKKLGISGIVNFRGEWLYTDIAYYLRERCDFFIMPSFYEALGCVYLEAMASGVAVLGVRSCGIDEVVTDRVSGYLVEPKNINQIADAITESITDAEKFNKIALEGYRTVTEKYTWENSAERLLQAYKRVIGK